MLIVKIKGLIAQVMEQCDVLYGRPGEGQVKRMQKVITRIQSISTWQQRLEVLGVKPEGEPDLDVFMTQILRGAWQRSLAKGYHKQVSSLPHCLLLALRAPPLTVRLLLNILILKC